MLNFIKYLGHRTTALFKAVVLDGFPNAVKFYLYYFNRIANFLSQFWLYRWLTNMRYFLCVVLYFGYLYGQRFFPEGSEAAKEIYFTGSAAFIFFFSLSALYKSHKTMNIASVVALFSFTVYLGFELANEICCDGYSDLWPWALFTALSLFIIGIVGYSFIIDDRLN